MARTPKAADEQAEARPLSVGRTSPVYVPAVHPDTGVDVVFVPGELLPEWVSDEAVRQARENVGVRW